MAKKSKKSKVKFSEMDLLSMQLGRLRKKPVNPHRSVSSIVGGRPCKVCGYPHSKAQHVFHGFGSFARTHS